MGDILVSHLKKAYGDHIVLEDFSARFPKGELSCVMGPSGCGKTTLLRLLMGLERAEGGEISGLEGRRLGAVFQEDRLCGGLTPVGNIRLVAPALSEGQVCRELEALGLSGCGGQPVGELSGGMRRRVAILRALLADWEVLLLDEPIRGLDEGAKGQTMAYMRQRCAGRTVLLVTHDRREAEALGASRFYLLLNSPEREK